MLNRNNIGVSIILLLSCIFWGCSQENKIERNDTFIDLDLEYVGKEKSVDLETKESYAYVVYKSTEEQIYYRIDIQLYEYENWDSNYNQLIKVKKNIKEEELFGEKYYYCIFNDKEIRMFEVDFAFISHLVNG